MADLSRSSDSLTAPALAVNDLAAAYQPRRVWGSALSIAWNLAWVGIFLVDGGAAALYRRVGGSDRLHGRQLHLGTMWAYVALLFAGYTLLNYPLELWFGYLEERQFGLAKDGIRAWSRDWLAGVAQHGILFCIGSSVLLILQIALPHTWLLWSAAALLAIFWLTSFCSLAMLPRALFQIDPADGATAARLAALLPAGLSLPRVFVFSAPHLRDFCGGLVGLGRCEAMLVSRSTLSAASDSLLRFVLLHDLGHRRYHHILLSTLAGWAWVVMGLCGGHAVIGHFWPKAVGKPPYIAYVALTLSLWMGIGEPILAYFGRRLEYQADRFYLRNGGTLPEMRLALEELSQRNLARTEGLRRRNTMFHPLPSVWNRLHAAAVFVERNA